MLAILALTSGIPDGRAQETTSVETVTTGSEETAVTTGSASVSETTSADGNSTSESAAGAQPQLPKGWSQIPFGPEWSQRIAAVGMYPENFLRVPQETVPEEQHRQLLSHRHYFMGSYFLEQKEAGRAQEEFEKALELAPGNSYIALGLVQAKLAAKELENAQTYLDKALAEDPKNVDALVLKGQVLFARTEHVTGDERKQLFKEAETAFLEAKKIQPKNLEALKGLATIYAQTQNVDDVVQAYKDIVAVNSKDTYSLLILARILSQTGRDEEAIGYYQRIIEQRRGYVNAYLMLGQVYEKLGRTVSALELYKTALLVEPRNKDVLERFEAMAQKLGDGPDSQSTLRSYEKFAKEYPYSSEVQRLYADRLVASRDFKAALGQLKRALTIDPENVEILLNIGNLLMQDKEFEQATEYYSKAIEADPEKTEIYDSIGTALLANNQRGKAIDIYEKAITRNPKVEKLYSALAALLVNEKRTSDSVKVLERGLQEIGDKPDLLGLLGEVYEKSGDHTKAAETYETAFGKAPQKLPLFAKLLGIYLRLGREADIKRTLDSATDAAEGTKDLVLSLAGETYYAQGKISEASEFYRKAFYVNPERMEYLARAIQILNQAGRYDESLAVLDTDTTAVDKKDRYRVNLLKGDVYLERRDYDKAVRIFQAHLAENADQLDSYQLLVDALNAAGRFDDSVAVIRDAEKKLGSSQALAVKTLLGLTYYKQKNYPQAEKVFRDLARGGSAKTDEAHYMLGSVYLDQKRYAQAEEAFIKAIEANPMNANALNALGFMYAERGIKLQKSRELIEQALEINPAPHIMDSMGWVLFRMGKIAEAREYVEKASYRMQDAEIFDHLGEIYNAMGEKEKSQKSFRRAYELDPKRPGLKSKIKPTGN